MYSRQRCVGLSPRAAATEEFEHAWSALTDAPPRKHVISDGTFAWKAAERDLEQADEARILLLVRLVGNSLFHGGKLLWADGRGYERDQLHIRASLAILRMAVDEAHARTKNNTRRRAVEPGLLLTREQQLVRAARALCLDRVQQNMSVWRQTIIH